MRGAFLLLSTTLLAVVTCGFTAFAVLHMGGYAPPPPVVTSAEEFVGPFASWTNVKTSCGAAGDGSTDDTAAIQTCLNNLSSTHPVLYIPSGTYKITACIYIGTTCTVGTVVTTVQHHRIICQDPATTTIVWAGASGGTMFYLDDMFHGAVARCTFNGNNLAAKLVVEDQPGGIIGSVAYYDNVFENAGSSGNLGIGLYCGPTAGCSEVSLLRDKFIGNSSIGAMTGNSNALNMWCWYCLFQNNVIGIGDGTTVGGVTGAGGFHAFKSVFQNSSFADIAVGNIVEENFIDNYSSGSAKFLSSGGLGGGAYPIILQGNIVLDTTASPSIFNDDSITILLDNTVRSAVGATAPVINLSTVSKPSDLLSVGNTLTLSAAGNCNGSSMPVSINIPVSGSRCHEFGDTTVDRSTVNPTPPTLPGVAPNLGRAIFDASALTGAAIQAAINSAAAACSNNVAHIPAGTYVVTSTISVPANCRVQIIGDGWLSVLTPSGSPNPMMRLNGPSQATLRDFAFSGAANAIDEIEVDNADQPGAVFYAENLSPTSNLPYGLFIDQLDNLHVELHDLLVAGNAGQTGVKVVGGPLAAAGNWQGGQVNAWAVNMESGDPSFDASAGAHLLVVSDWFESAPGTKPYVVTGVGTVFTHAGASMALDTPAPATLTDFQGTAALLGENMIGPHGTTPPVTVISGNGSGANDLMLGAGVGGPPSNTTSPPATLGFLNSYTYYSTTQVPESGVSSQPFLTTALTQLRSAHPTLPTVGASGVTSVYIVNVNTELGKCGIHVEAGSGVTC